MKTAAQAPQFLTPAEVSARWNGAVGTGTLANWRSKGEGPPYQKFGARVRYPIATLEAWEAKNIHGAPANDNEEKHQKAS